MAPDHCCAVCKKVPVAFCGSCKTAYNEFFRKHPVFWGAEYTSLARILCLLDEVQLGTRDG